MTTPVLDPNHPLTEVTGLGAFKSLHDRKGRMLNLIAAAFFALLGVGIVAAGVGYSLYEVMSFGSSRWDNVMPALILGVVVGGLLFLVGAWSLFTAIRDWKLTVGLYEQGVGVVTNSGLQMVRWDQVNAIYQQVTRHYTNGVYTGTTHRYTLIGADGKKHILDDRLKDVEALGNAVQDGVNNALFPRYAQAVNSGQRVDFGPLGLDRQQIYAGKKSLPWSEIKAIKIERGNIAIKKEGGWFNWSAVTVPQVPNFWVFYALIRNFATVE